MARFPSREGDVKTLAQNILAGQTVNAATYPAPPGTAFESLRQGEDWLFLDWREPSDGSAVASYKIERRLRPSVDWVIVGMATESEATLNDQERYKDWEYHIIAANKAGEGAPSNKAVAVV